MEHKAYTLCFKSDEYFKSLWVTPPIQIFLFVLFCPCTCLLLLCAVGQSGCGQREWISALQSPLTSLWFHSALHAIFFSSSRSFLHLFTHLLEEGHNEINISFSREKAVCLLLSVSYHLHHSFIFSIIHSMKVALREMPSFARVLSVYMSFHIYVVMLFSHIDSILCCFIFWCAIRHSLLLCHMCVWLRKGFIAEVAAQCVP